jgi:hypothetical protein
VIATPGTAKHRIFVRIGTECLAEHAFVVFPNEEYVLFGILQSRFHDLWAYGQGTQVRERESGFRYTPTTCFGTFPLPELSKKQAYQIGAIVQQLDELRSEWLDPVTWTKEQTIEFAATATGPWCRFIPPETINTKGIGTARYSRRVPKDATAASELKKRTLTNLYNKQPDWLVNIHANLDAAVADAYGWKSDISDDDVFRRLLQLNQKQSR